MMVPVVAFAICAVAMGIVAFLYHHFGRRRRLIRELSGKRAVKIAKFEEGVRKKVVGTLEYDGEPLVSPLTGRSCAYYHITVEEYLKRRNRDDDPNDGKWYEIIREEKRVHFALSDPTGRAIVDTGKAEVVADVCVELKSGTFDEPTTQEEEYLATHGKRGKDWFLNKRLRYREGVLEEGELVSVFGYGTLEPDPDGASAATGLRDLPPLRLTLSGTHDEPLLISDNTATLK